jgi:hypothetical protein
MLPELALEGQRSYPPFSAGDGTCNFPARGISFAPRENEGMMFGFELLLAVRFG